MIALHSILWRIESQANWPHQLSAANGRSPTFGAYNLNPNRVAIHNALFYGAIAELAQSLLMT